MPQGGGFVSKGGAPTIVAPGHRCPNVESEVAGPSASREDRTVRPDKWRETLGHARAACIIWRFGSTVSALN